jgi:hypothetical protein
MRLLCPSGGCVPLDQYGACNVAKAAARAFVARPNWANSGVGQSVVAAMDSANSSAVMGGVGLIDEDYPVSDDTESLTKVTGSFSDYFGASAVAAFERIRALEVSGGSKLYFARLVLSPFSVALYLPHPDLGHTC